MQPRRPFLRTLRAGDPRRPPSNSLPKPQQRAFRRVVGRHLSRSSGTSSLNGDRRERSASTRLRTSPQSPPRRFSRLRGRQRFTSAHSNAAVIRPSFIAVIARLSRPCLDRVLFLRTPRPSLSFRRRRRYFQRRRPRNQCRLYQLLYPTCSQQGPTRSPSPPAPPHPKFRRRRNTRPRLLPPHQLYHRRRIQSLLILRNANRLPEPDCRARRSLSRLLLLPPRLSFDLRISSPPIIHRILAFYSRRRHWHHQLPRAAA